MAGAPGPLESIADALTVMAGVLTPVALGVIAFWQKHKDLMEGAPLKRARVEDEIATDNAQHDLNDAAQGLIDRLREDNAALRSECNRERESGLGHYQRTLRLYAMLARWFHDWQAGKPPPAEMPRMEDI